MHQVSVMYLGAAVHMLLAMLYCDNCSYAMPQKKSESETVEVPRSLLKHLLSKVESLEAMLQVSQEERQRRRG